MAVDGWPADAELGRDLRDGVRAFAVVAGLVVHFSRQLDLAGTQLRLLTASPAARASCCEAVKRAFGHKRVLELRDRPEDMEEHPSHSGGGVDALVEHDQIDAALLQEPGELDQVLEGAAEPAEVCNHQLVA